MSSGLDEKKSPDKKSDLTSLDSMRNLKNYITAITRLSVTSWSILQDCAMELTLKRKDYLLSEGEVCQGIFFINTGLCRSLYNRDGEEINTGFHFEREFVTNIKSLRSSAGSEYAIQAIEKCSIIKLEKTKLIEAYKQSREIETFGRLMLESLSLQQQEHADTFKLLNPKQRFDHLVSTRPDFLQRVSLTQAASYLGISRETLTRLRAEK